MRFRSGGITLTSLCVILLQLAEEGVVKLDDPIAQWCQDLPTARAVTLRMLTESTFWNPSWTGPSGRLVSTMAEVGRIGNALTGPGLLSEKFRKEPTTSDNVGIGPNTKERFYAMGVGVIGDWIIPNPNMNGFPTFMVTLPRGLP